MPPFDPTVPVGPYGALVVGPDDGSDGGVQALVPHRVLGPSSHPTDAQVAGFLAQTSSWIAGRLGDLSKLDAASSARIAAAGKGLAEMGAAALAENAGSPERAGKAGTGYGDWLWSQFLVGIDALLLSIGKATDEHGGGSGEVPVADVPAYVSPEPMFLRDTGF